MIYKRDIDQVDASYYFGDADIHESKIWRLLLKAFYKDQEDMKFLKLYSSLRELLCDFTEINYDNSQQF